MLELDNEKVNTELEKQYNDSLSNKIQHKVHCGIGFADETEPSRNYYYQRPQQQQQQQQKSSLEDKKAQYKKMSFVKSSD